MPTAPLSRCSWPGCPTKVPRGRSRCDEHAAQADRERNAAKPWRRSVYKGDWEDVRTEVLSANPICQCRAAGCHPDGCGRRSAEVDHIVPVGPPRYGDPRARSNLQALCGRCHKRKTARDQIVARAIPRNTIQANVTEGRI